MSSNRSDYCCEMGIANLFAVVSGRIDTLLCHFVPWIVSG